MWQRFHHMHTADMQRAAGHCAKGRDFAEIRMSFLDAHRQTRGARRREAKGGHCTRRTYRHMGVPVLLSPQAGALRCRLWDAQTDGGVLMSLSRCMHTQAPRGRFTRAATLSICR